MDDARLLQLVDCNYFSSVALLVACSQRGESLENHDLVLCSSGFALPEYNLVFIKPGARRFEDAVAYGRAYFAERDLPHCFRVRQGRHEDAAQLLAELGYVEKRTVPGRVLAPLECVEPAPCDLDIRRVRGARELEDFGRVAFEGFGQRGGEAPLFLTEQIAEHPSVQCFLGYRDGRAVCTSMLIELAGIAGIYWVATLPEQRRRGFGEQITHAALRAAHARGLRAASLQTSDLGRSLYARMGFRSGPHYRSYDSPAIAQRSTRSTGGWLRGPRPPHAG